MSEISLASIKPEFRDDPGAAALVNLINRCPYTYGGLTGGTAPILSFLRSIHCGSDSPLDLEHLIKRLEAEPFKEVMQVMAFYRRIWNRPCIEIYKVFIDERTIERRLYKCFNDE